MKTRKTKDIRLATVWMALGAKFVKADKADISHQEFEFCTEDDGVGIDEKKQVEVTRGVDLDLIERQFVNRELLVNAADLLDAFQRMKSVIHSK